MRNRTRSSWRERGIGSVCWLLLAGCATSGQVCSPSQQGELAMSIRSPWESSNDWAQFELLWMRSGDAELEVVDRLGIGGGGVESWKLRPGVYLLREPRGATDHRPRTGVWVEVLSGQVTRVDWAAVRIASGYENYRYESR